MANPGTVNLINTTHRWVLGYCIEWNWQAKQFSDTTSQAFTDFVERTHTVVYLYLMGRRELTGACSDFECTLASEAKAIFSHLVEK